MKIDFFFLILEKMVLGMDEWFFNFSQFGVRNLDEKALATVPNPQLEYTIHGFIKGCEITSILGIFYLFQIWIFIRIYLKIEKYGNFPFHIKFAIFL